MGGRIRGRTRQVVRHGSWPLLVGICGWALAGLFLFAWLFDFGRGSIDVDRIGTAGEWASGLATVAAVVLSLYLVLHERRERERESEQRRRSADVRKLMKSFEDESALEGDLRERVVISGRWRRLDEQAEGGDDLEGDYLIEFDLFNGLDRPLASVEAKFSLTRDWNLADFEDEQRSFPPWVQIAASRLVEPGERVVFPSNSGHFRLPNERVRNGAGITASWQIGRHRCSWTKYGDPDRVFWSVWDREAAERRSAEKAREDSPTAPVD